MVPVLSRTTTDTSRAVWMASALRMISPLRDAAPVPVMRAMGVASPRAQGQAMTMVVMKAKTARETGSRTDVTQWIHCPAPSRKEPNRSAHPVPDKKALTRERTARPGTK